MFNDWFYDAVQRLGPVGYIALMVLMALAIAALLPYSFTRLRFLRIMEDTPTARVRSAAQGFVELEGQVEFPRTPALRSPLQSRPCVWWSYRIEELDPEDKGFTLFTTLYMAVMSLLQMRPTGRLLDSGTSHECFLIRDASGACVVDPDSAEVMGAQTRTWRIGSKRLEESVIAVGDPIYALGVFNTPRDLPAEVEAREVGTLISEWKLNRLELARRFDANQNGELEAAEWEAAWQAATAQVRQRHARPGPVPELHVLCKPKDGRPFVLSGVSQERLVARFWFQSITRLLACAILASLMLWTLRIRGLI